MRLYQNQVNHKVYEVNQKPTKLSHRQCIFISCQSRVWSSVFLHNIIFLEADIADASCWDSYHFRDIHAVQGAFLPAPASILYSLLSPSDGTLVPTTCPGFLLFAEVRVGGRGGTCLSLVLSHIHFQHSLIMNSLMPAASIRRWKPFFVSLAWTGMTH